MKTLASKELIQMWVNTIPRDDCALKNRHESLSARGLSLFSYGTEIARAVYPGNKSYDFIVLVGDEEYSVTTSKQPTFRVPGAAWGDYILSDRSTNWISREDKKRFIDYMKAEREALWRKLVRARGRQGDYLKMIRQWTREIEDFQAVTRTCYGKRRVVSLDQVPDQDFDDNEEVMALLDEFQKLRHTQWMTPSASNHLWDKMEETLKFQAVQLKHARVDKDAFRITQVFAKLLVKYPYELKTLLDLKAFVNS
jgi:hypothetical protein